MNNYPPGVTGNEPQISGVLPPEDLAAGATETIKKVTTQLSDLACLLEDHGALPDRLDRMFIAVDAQLVDLDMAIEAHVCPEEAV